MTRLTPIDTPHAYELSELVLRVSECVEAVSEWCRSVSIDTSVGRVDGVQVSIDTGVKVSSRGSTSLILTETYIHKQKRKNKTLTNCAWYPYLHGRS